MKHSVRFVRAKSNSFSILIFLDNIIDFFTHHQKLIFCYHILLPILLYLTSIPSASSLLVTTSLFFSIYMFVLFILVFIIGSTDSSDCKESVCSVRDQGSIPGLERFPGEGNDNPLQYSCLEKSMDQGVWWAEVMRLQRVRHNWVTNS